MESQNPNEEPLSNDPEEALRLENELMKIKMQAELGAQFGGSIDDLPPEIEHQFLKQMMAFEEQLQQEPTTTLAEHLGDPEFPPVDSFTGAEPLEAAWKKLGMLLDARGIRVEFLAKDYPTALRYDFIVRECFPVKIHPPMVDGQYLVLTYEDVHPDHFFDMENRVHELFNEISNNELHPGAPYLSEQIVTDTGLQLSKAQYREKLSAFHDQFASVSPFRYEIMDRSRQAEGEEWPKTDLGYVEGLVEYDVVHHDGSSQTLKGPFKVYLQYVHDWWEVFFFQLFGFSWA